MAAVTFAITDPDTSNLSSYPVLSFTPAVNDLIVVFALFMGSVEPGATFAATDNEGATYTRVSTALFGTSANSLVCLVRNQLVASASGHIITVTCTGDAATGNVTHVYRVSGMTKAGATAVMQSAKVENIGAGGTPAPVFGASVLTTNPTLGGVASGKNPVAVTEPTSWTEGADDGFTTPAGGLESVFRDSGFTGTTVTWGSAVSAAQHAAIVVELDASAAATDRFFARTQGPMVQAVRHAAVM